MALILIIDDEADLLSSLEYSLQKEGHSTRSATTGAEGLCLARMAPTPDLVLLDLMLPDISGTEVCRQLRANAPTRSLPVVMLTAKTEEIDRVVGFEVGADDYVSKPFSLRELLLRIQAILRRFNGPPPNADSPTAPEIMQFGRLRLDIPGHRVWVDETEISLTALEFRLLSTLLERRGRVQTREQLLDDVWGIQAEITTRTVDTHVKRVRQRIGAAGHYIETLRGVGYRFRATPEDDRAP